MIDCQATDIDWPTDNRHQVQGTVIYHGVDHHCGLGPGHSGLHRCRCGVRSLNSNSDERTDSGRPSA